MNFPKAPNSLGDSGKEWWKKAVKLFEFSAPELALLEEAALCLDRLEQARAVIDRDGLTYLDPKRGPRMRPEVVIERDCRAAFARLCKQLEIGEVEAPAKVPGARVHRRSTL